MLVELKKIYQYLLSIKEAIFGLRYYEFFKIRSKNIPIYSKISYNGLKEQAERFLKEFESFNVENDYKIGNNRKVGFIWFCTGTPKEIRMQITFAKILEKMNFEVFWIVSKIEETHSVEYDKYSYVKKRAELKKLIQILDMYGMKYYYLETIDFDFDFNEIKEKGFKNHNTYKIGFNSSLKFTKNDFDVRDFEKSKINSAMKAYMKTYKALEQFIKINNVDVFSIEGGQYANSKAVLDFANDNNKKCITVENFGANKLIFGMNVSCYSMPIEQVVDCSNAKDFIAEGKQTIEDIRSGKYYGRQFSNDNKKVDLPFENYLLIIPNVTWDSATWYFDSNFYESQYEWLFDTIDYCIKNDKPFVIRCHPGEKLMKSKYPLYDVLVDYMKKYKDFKQYKIISHNDDSSTYSLIEKADKAILYVSTMGLELIHYNLPVIVVGNPYYKKRGFNIFPQTKEEYYNYLDTSLTVKEEEKRNLYIYTALLQNFRISLSYGEFFKYTGRDELKRWNLAENEFEKGFPFQQENIEQYLYFIMKNLTDKVI
ncbi:hypothetical protein Q6A89_02055 [Aliarcobacter skirrowii]|uniref:capsular polysaccharide export protein, LipB/KpsS family n=1 Tax=Aliarcobacter skirrowii TaxID=28200 RepID=UPI0029B4CEE5|nr:hypothetical protein [Aliarcobacter skirrowii]MDX4059292.1 hypothetical protein [Aliarcobacter skirrowii]